MHRDIDKLLQAIDDTIHQQNQPDRPNQLGFALHFELMAQNKKHLLLVFSPTFNDDWKGNVFPVIKPFLMEFHTLGFRLRIWLIYLNN